MDVREIWWESSLFALLKNVLIKNLVVGTTRGENAAPFNEASILNKKGEMPSALKLQDSK